MSSNQNIGMFDNNFNIFNDVYFLPKLKYVDYGIIFVIIFVILYLVLQYNYIYSNWEKLKCNHIFWSPLYFKNSKQTFEQCNTGKIDSIIDNELGSITKNIKHLKAEYKKAEDTLETKKDPAVLEKEVKLPLNNILNSLNNNVTRISESINTIVKSIIVSSKINEKLGTNEGQFLDIVKNSNLASFS